MHFGIAKGLKARAWDKDQQMDRRVGFNAYGKIAVERPASNRVSSEQKLMKSVSSAFTS
jgi:hypothetical protein